MTDADAGAPEQNEQVEQVQAATEEQPAAAEPVAQEPTGAEEEPVVASAEGFAAAQAQAAEIAARLANKRALEGADDGEPDSKRVNVEENGSHEHTGAMSGAEETTFTMYAPPEKVGRIIGRGGVTIKDLESRTGCRIQVDHNHKGEGDQKPVHISGSAAAVEVCKALVIEVMENENPAAAPGDASRMLECPPGIVGRIIGRGGETIRSLQSASGAHILVDQNFPPEVNRQITITGKQDAVERAHKMILDLISGDPGSAQQVIQKVLGSYGIGVTRALECPKTVVGRVIGKGGETIKTLQKQFGTSIQIDQSANPCKITIAGPSHSTSACERAIIDIIEDRPHSMGFDAGPRGGGGGVGGGFGGAPFGGYGAAPYAGGYGGYGAAPYGGYGGYGAPAYGGYGAQYPQPGYGQGYGGYGAADPYAGYAAAGAPQGAAAGGSVWQEQKDDQGRSYWYNSVTGVSQWEKPQDA